MPTLSAGLSKTKTDNRDTNVNSAYDSKTISLSGNIPQLGLGYSTNIFNETTYTKPAPKQYLGSYNYSFSLNLLKGFGPRVGYIPFRQA